MGRTPVKSASKLAAEHDVSVPSVVDRLTPKKSLSEIANMLTENAMKMRGETYTPTPAKDKDDEADTESENEAIDVDQRDGDDVSDDGEDEDGVDEAGTGADAGEDADAGGEQEDQGSQEALTEKFEYDDDDLVELVEGDSLETVSLGDLKRAYLNDKTSLDRAKEVDEAVDEAIRIRAKAQQDALTTQGAINAILSHVSNLVAQPMVGKPDEALRSTDPARYIQQMDAYQADMQRVAQANSTLEQAVAAYQQHTQSQNAERARTEIRKLEQVLPALQNAATRKDASKDILDAAAHYGFSEQEINANADHRLYLMAYEAQQYRKLVAKSPERAKKAIETEEKAKKKAKATRTLRSKGTTAASRPTAAQKKLRVLKSTAKKSGSTKDVAAYLNARRGA